MICGVAALVLKVILHILLLLFGFLEDIDPNFFSSKPTFVVHVGGNTEFWIEFQICTPDNLCNFTSLITWFFWNLMVD